MSFPELTAEEWILMFLLARQKSEIHGKLMFVKELFIASNEIEEISQNLREIFKFYPSHYGPYSDVFENSLRNLEAVGDIITKEETINAKTRIIYGITEKGEKRIQIVYGKLPEIVRERISKLKKGADQLGYVGILKHVYTHYPKYIIRSRIKGEVFEY
ncbi:MAG: hypothetical protein HXS48_06340 [Theionarchaea archaeon]|nr:hypothetical protein [Theionarchaea archaeon]